MSNSDTDIKLSGGAGSSSDPAPAPAPDARYSRLLDITRFVSANKPLILLAFNTVVCGTVTVVSTFLASEYRDTSRDTSRADKDRNTAIDMTIFSTALAAFSSIATLFPFLVNLDVQRAFCGITGRDRSTSTDDLAGNPGDADRLDPIAAPSSVPSTFFVGHLLSPGLFTTSDASNNSRAVVSTIGRTNIVGRG